MPGVLKLPVIPGGLLRAPMFFFSLPIIAWRVKVADYAWRKAADYVKAAGYVWRGCFGRLCFFRLPIMPGMLRLPIMMPGVLRLPIMLRLPVVPGGVASGFFLGCQLCLAC